MVTLRPLAALEPRTTYVVAIHGMKDLDEQLIEAPLGFRALRDGTIDNVELNSLKTKYESTIFPLIALLGFHEQTYSSHGILPLAVVRGRHRIYYKARNWRCLGWKVTNRLLR